MDILGNREHRKTGKIENQGFLLGVNTDFFRGIRGQLPLLHAPGRVSYILPETSYSGPESIDILSICIFVRVFVRACLRVGVCARACVFTAVMGHSFDNLSFLLLELEPCNDSWAPPCISLSSCIFRSSLTFEHNQWLYIALHILCSKHPSFFLFVLVTTYCCKAICLQKLLLARLLEVCSRQEAHGQRVAHMSDKATADKLPTKYRVNWPFGSGEEAKNRFSRWRPWRPSWFYDRHDFSYFWSTSHPDAPYQVWSQLAFWFMRRKQYRFSRWLPWISDGHDFSYFWSISHPNASYQVWSQLAFGFRSRSEK